MAKMKARALVDKAVDIAKNHKTLYVMGCFGAPLTGGNVTRYCSNHTYNKAADRTAMIKAAANQSPPVYGFDCVCLIKGILWGWSGNPSATYGGAKYASNGVQDIGADQTIKVCTGVTTDFSSITLGEAVWRSGHIGIYIGDGLAVECTPIWENKVQITAVANMGAKPGYNARTWTKHGKLPWVDYADEVNTAPTVKVTGTASTGSAADEKTIWDFLKGKGLNDFAVAGIMGNIYAESGLRSNNLQNSYEKSLGHTDATYTAAVDNGSYSNFANDSAGYGLCQWTYHTRKAALLKYAQAAKKSIADLATQLAFMWDELQGYSKVMATLKAATSVQEASNAFMVSYENPADQSTSAKAKRASYGEKYYSKYASTAPAKPSTGASAVATTLPDIGTEVDFKGTKHFVSSNSTNPKSCKPGRAKVTALAKNGKHPVHLIRTSGGGSTVYGWVDLADISTAPAAELRTHKVVRGDTLWGIAQKYLGNGNRYKEIMELNGLKSSTIYAGQVFKIPAK